MSKPKKYVVLHGDGKHRISDIVADCALNLCVDTKVGESLDSILRKICSQITRTQTTYIEEGDNVNITGDGSYENPYVVSATGAITSIGLTMPHGFNVSNSPLYSDGTINVTTSLSGIVQATGTGFSTITIGEGLDFTNGILSAKAEGTTYINQGQGILVTGDGKQQTPYVITLDLDSKELVPPVIFPTWSVYKNDGSTFINSSTTKNLIVETGSKVGISATYRYTISNVITQAGPTSTSGTWGGFVYPPATNSHVFDNSGLTISTNQTYSQTLYKPKSGLIVENNQVKFPTGNNQTSDSISITFYYASYFGYSSKTSLTASEIKALGSKALQPTRKRSLTGVSAGTEDFTYYCYPASYGPLSNAIQNQALPILGAFTRLADVVIVNDVGISVTMAVYKSNARNAFTNVFLDFT